MSSQGIEVKKTVPHKAMFMDNLLSTAKSVRNRRQVEFRPTENTEFKFQGNSKMIFNVSSSSEWMDSTDHYMRFTLRTGSEASYVRKSLNIGGGHNFIRCLEIRLQNGQLIERIDRYNRLYAIKSLSTHSRDHVEWYEQAAGDSVSGVTSLDRACGGEFAEGTYTITAAGVVTASKNVFTFGITNRLYNVGDVFDAYSVVGQLLASGLVVRTITAANGATVEGTLNAAIPAGSYLRKVSSRPQRAEVVKGLDINDSKDDVDITIKLCSDFLTHKKFIPLKFLKQGLQIIIDLERPEFVMSSNQPYANAPAFDYVIKDPVLFATMVTLEKSVDDMHMAQFNGKGMNMEFMSYQHRLNVDQSGGPGTVKFSNNVGRRSVRNVYTVIQPIWSESVSRQSYNFDNTATFLKTGLTRYQYKVGAEEFPYREVELKDSLNARAFTELAITNGQHGGTIFDCRFCPSEWRTENYFPGIETQAGSGIANAESKHLILSTRLDRDNSPWTGVNTSINPLEIELSFDGTLFIEVGTAASVAKTRYIHSFIGYDSVLNISSEGTLVYN